MASVIDVEPQLAVPSSDTLYEIIDGQIVELPPMSIYASFLAFQLDGGSILPGFRLPLADLFQPETPA